MKKRMSDMNAQRRGRCLVDRCPNKVVRDASKRSLCVDLCGTCNDRLGYLVEIVNVASGIERDGAIADFSEADHALLNAYLSGWL